jgi:predicted AlkP superfamily pyrophosphatase or phosphodiesterase
MKGKADMAKVILVLSDALRFDAAMTQMGYLGHLVETKQASLHKVIGELPSLSRPMYETVHTGLPVSEHGIFTNQVIRRSDKPNIFQIAVQAGKTTAAAAYAWFSELYNHSPYDRINDREVDDSSLAIQHGRFYSEDDFPDIELFADGAMLARRFAPDYLLIHPMGLDYTGETFGADTRQYRAQARLQDMILAILIPEALEQGYTVLITGDHGIDADGIHGGTTPEMREVPLFLVRPDQKGEGFISAVLSQLQIAPTICTLLGLPIPETMRHRSII